MVYQLQQTDTAATDGAIAACSGINAGTATDNRQATSGGTPGATTNTVTAPNNGTVTVRLVHFESAPNELNALVCPPGNWTWRLNITTGNTLLTIDDVFICRVNSSGVSQQTIASVIGLGIIASAGVKSGTIAGLQATFSPGDRLYIVIGGTSQAAAGESIVYTPNQLIDTPLTTPSGVFLSRRFNCLKEVD